MAINTRSPYYVSIKDASISYATLDIFIWSGNSSSPPSPAQYSLKKFKISTNTLVSFEISELIRDYIDITFSGGYEGQAVWMKYDVKAYDSSNVLLDDDGETILAVDGYSYFEEPNFDIDDSPVMISNRTIFALSDNAFRVPIYTGNNPTITFFKDGAVVSTQTFPSSNDSIEQMKYVSINGTHPNWDTYAERVIEDSGTFENSYCLQNFFDEFHIGEVDKVQVTDSNKTITIDVKTLDECRYDPKKITFVNKFGVLQDMYFFKKAVEKMTVKKESYKSNIRNSTNTYSTSQHVNSNFNVVGKESITLSSGFLDESYNEVFKQMMLSEKVWITNVTEGVEQVLPINVKTSNIIYKTSLNDRLIEYTFDFDNSFDTINNIR